MDIHFVRLSAVFLIIISYLRPIITVEDKRCFQPNPGLSNGCSIPFEKFPFKESFTPICNRHDICYTCATKFAKSRYYCDGLFSQDMQKVCNRIEDVFKREECYGYADKYHGSVKVSGILFFRKRAKCQCNQKWVPSCFP